MSELNSEFMSEEKEAVEHLNSFLNITEYVWIKEKERLMVNIKIVLNLIEKQQNKIQALEKQHDYDMQMIDEVKGNAVKWANELEQEKEKNKELEKDNKNLNVLLDAKYKDVTYMLLNYISKDKIKEKIEEKIEETNKEKLNYSEDEYYLENEIKGYTIDKLKELLEEV